MNTLCKCGHGAYVHADRGGSEGSWEYGSCYHYVGSDRCSCRIFVEDAR